MANFENHIFRKYRSKWAYLHRAENFTNCAQNSIFDTGPCKKFILYCILFWKLKILLSTKNFSTLHFCNFGHFHFHLLDISLLYFAKKFFLFIQEFGRFENMSFKVTEYRWSIVNKLWINVFFPLIRLTFYSITRLLCAQKTLIHSTLFYAVVHCHKGNRLSAI